MEYQGLAPSLVSVKNILSEYYNLEGECVLLPGEIDFNYKVKTANNSQYILKISPFYADQTFFDFQEKLLLYLDQNKKILHYPKIIPTTDGTTTLKIIQDENKIHFVRLLTWIDGVLWSSYGPKTSQLRYFLGQVAGEVTNAIQNFDHKYAFRNFDWQLDGAEWTENHLDLFDQNQNQIVLYFQNKFDATKNKRNTLRKGVIHNDVNDNNILVNATKSPVEIAIIDYGDAVYSALINDLAVTATYAIMDVPDPLSAAAEIIRGYHTSFPLKEEEIIHLYMLIGMRLVLSVTKSAINKTKDPNNTYLQISEKPAWQLLETWYELDENLVHYTFRKSIGLMPVPQQEEVVQWLKTNKISLKTLFPNIHDMSIGTPDMSVGSTFLGHRSVFENDQLFWGNLKTWCLENANKVPVNGYLEVRPFYSTNAYKKEGNSGPEYRTVHLGTDIWLEANTPLHAPLAGTVHSVYNNDHHKDYGPTVILQHVIEDWTFYTLYGHLSKNTLSLLNVGDTITKGTLIGYIGDIEENGHWAPHVHFQIILDMLGFTSDFPGVAFPKNVDIWKSLCPDPAYLFDDIPPTEVDASNTEHLLTNRNQILGKNLSLSYQKPLHIVRGEGAYLIDNLGQKFLDTVNNVAHVGHEHIQVVQAAQKQVALLNTNTRYLHENILKCAENILSTLPPHLSVVYFVNSGSEANELALRMVYACTGRKDMLAIEVGYHGNTNSCIDLSSYKFDGKVGKGKPEHTHILPLPDTFRGVHTGQNAGQQYAKYAEDVVADLQSKGKSLAGFIHESIISCGGQIELPTQYLSSIYNLVQSEGGLCIADEVQTGLGRVGTHWWAFESHQVKPDIVTIGKPLGNGHPVAAVVCTQDVAEKFANGMEYFNTFGGNPVSCAIANAVIDVVKAENMMENARTIGDFLKNGLQSLQNKYPIIGDVRGQGLFLGFEFTSESLVPLASHTEYFSNRMKDFSILTSTDGPDQNVIKIKPPMCFSLSQAEEFLDRTEYILRDNIFNNY